VISDVKIDIVLMKYRVWKRNATYIETIHSTVPSELHDDCS
jgi:hypothetical protein